MTKAVDENNDAACERNYELRHLGFLLNPSNPLAARAVKMGVPRFSVSGQLGH